MCDPCCMPCGPCGPCGPCAPSCCMPRRCKSRELRGSVLLTQCDCPKRNGLQADCPRAECQGRPCCLTKPCPSCCPAKYVFRYTRMTHGRPTNPRPPRCCVINTGGMGCNPCVVKCETAGCGPCGPCGPCPPSCDPCCPPGCDPCCAPGCGPCPPSCDPCCAPGCSYPYDCCGVVGPCGPVPECCNPYPCGGPAGPCC